MYFGCHRNRNIYNDQRKFIDEVNKKSKASRKLTNKNYVSTIKRTPKRKKQKPPNIF